MTTKTRTFKIYELDIHDSLIVLADELSVSGEAPMYISYVGVEDDHTLWQVEVYGAD